MLWGVFGTKRDEVWWGLHYKEFHDFYFPSDIIIMTKLMTTRWAKRVTPVGGKRKACKFVKGKCVSMLPPGKHRYSWKYNRNGF